MKKALIVFLVLCLVVAALGFVLPYLFVNQTDIVGGADLPSASFYMRTQEGQICMLMQLFGVAGAIVCTVYLLLYRYFSPVRALFTLGASASASAALSCGLLFAGCFIMSSPHRHPIALPFSIIGGTVAVIVFFLLMHLHIKQLKTVVRAKAVIADTVVFTVFLLPFIYLFDFIYSFLRILIK